MKKTTSSKLSRKPKSSHNKEKIIKQESDGKKSNSEAAKVPKKKQSSEKTQSPSRKPKKTHPLPRKKLNQHQNRVDNQKHHKLKSQ